MRGSKIAIAESADNLRALMKKQKVALSYAKLQVLYLIKIQACRDDKISSCNDGTVRIYNLLLVGIVW